MFSSLHSVQLSSLRALATGKRHPDVGREDIAAGMKHNALCTELCELQRHGGRHAVLEQPASSTAWKLEGLADALARYYTYRAVFVVCRYGVKLDGPPVNTSSRL